MMKVCLFALALATMVTTAFAEVRVLRPPSAGARITAMKETIVGCVDVTAISALIVAVRLDQENGSRGTSQSMRALAQQVGCDTLLPAGHVVFVEQTSEAHGKAIECIRPNGWAKCYWALAGNVR